MPRRSDSDSDSASRSSKQISKPGTDALAISTIAMSESYWLSDLMLKRKLHPPHAISASKRWQRRIRQRSISIDPYRNWHHLRAITAIHTAQKWDLRKGDSDLQCKSPCNATGLLPPTKYVGRSYLHSELLACSKPELIKQWYDSLREALWKKTGSSPSRTFWMQSLQKHSQPPTAASLVHAPTLYSCLAMSMTVPLSSAFRIPAGGR